MVKKKEAKTFDHKPPQSSPKPVSASDKDHLLDQINDQYAEAQRYFASLHEDTGASYGPAQNVAPPKEIEPEHHVEEMNFLHPDHDKKQPLPAPENVLEQQDLTVAQAAIAQDDPYNTIIEEAPIIEQPKEVVTEEVRIHPVNQVSSEPVEITQESVAPKPAEQGSPLDYLEEMNHEQTLQEQFAQAIAKQDLHPRHQVTIKLFSDQYTQAKQLINQNKLDHAHEHYTQMVRYYQDIKKADVADVHKQIAHHGLEEIYDHLQTTDKHEAISKRTFVTMMIASVLLLLVGVTLVLNPSISGLAVLEQTIPTYTGPSSFEIFGPRKIDFSDMFSMNSEHLAVLATRSSHVDVQIDGTSLIVVPEPGFAGEEVISIIGVNTAMSPHRMTKVPITLIVR